MSGAGIEEVGKSELRLWELSDGHEVTEFLEGRSELQGRSERSGSRRRLEWRKIRLGVV
jgi:hypothetical protein